MADAIGGINNNPVIFHVSSQEPVKIARELPKSSDENRNLDKFANADINPDTMDKIPEDKRKFFSSGNQVTLLADSRITPDDKSDDIFAEVEKMIRNANSSISIEMFNLDNKNIVDMLIAESKKGINVQIVTHPPDEASYPTKQKAMDKLRSEGIEVLEYPVKAAGVDSKYGNLCHVKLLVVDGKQAIIGGMNWGNLSKNNHDINVKVEGPAVDQMEWIFREDWKASGGDETKLPKFEKTSPHPEGDALVNVITAGPERRQQTYGNTVIRAIDNAKRSVHAQLFTLTDRNVVQSLIKAKERGIDVKVIAHPLKIKDSAVNERAVQTLKEAGVPVRWYVCDPNKREKMHAKAAAFDDDQAIIGSANWTYSGFNANREAGVEVLSKTVNSKLTEIFLDNWETRTSEEPIYLEKPVTDPGG